MLSAILKLFLYLMNTLPPFHTKAQRPTFPFPQHFIGKIFKHTEKLEEFSSEHSTTRNINSSTDIVLFYHVSVCWSIPLSIHRTVLIFCAFQNAHSLFAMLLGLRQKRMTSERRNESAFPFHLRKCCGGDRTCLPSSA